MLARIAQAVGRPAPQIAPEALSAIDWNGGSEARFLAKFLPLKNTSYISPNASPAFADDDNGTFDRDVTISGLPKVTFDVFRTKRPQAALLPPMLIFGTSFSDYIFALHYNALFETIYQTRAETPGDIVPLLGHLPDDVKIFLLEMPEPFLSRIASMDPSPNCTAAHPSAGDAPRQRRP
jgi:hypothetical protein